MAKLGPKETLIVEEIVPDWTPEEEIAVIKKIDWYLLPLVLAIHFMASMDAGNLGQARAYSLDAQTGLGRMERDLGMVSGDFNNLSSVNYIVLLFLEPVSNFFLMKFKPHIWLSRIMITWGICATVTSVVTDFPGLLICRVFLGISEAGLTPGLMLAFSYWYSPRELLNRVATLHIAGSIVSFLSAITAGLVFYLDSPTSPAWRWLFLIEGAPSIILGIFCIILFPDGPEVATFLTPRGRRIAIERLKLADPASRKGRDFVWKDALPVYTKLETWLHIAALLLSLLPAVTMKFFMPTLLAQVGFTGASIQYATIPPHAFGVVAVIIVSWIVYRVDDRSIVHIVGNLAGAVGYVVLAFSQSATLSYGKSVLALAASGSNVAGILGSQLYRAKDAPRYTNAHLIVAGALCVSALVVLTLRIIYMVKNSHIKARIEQKKLMGEKPSDADTFVYPL
ncbi:hypothetical protein SmJEL517_g01325 [Synchytrium microbalum]|uniref:Major facilitator superfamily (MFS) profile domain-containing protein n=1 Tax=Synchytrium microbalum TaxID=1806994 RepID=A0A507CGB0_9FUNG|nr:uncharacterized protein SmJEL517_g01325 [Synchytrium microbalum]TPX36645.1 hypothetical protein SmJEL517_g01325 [Synchytrium microbalum]